MNVCHAHLATDLDVENRLIIVYSVTFIIFIFHFITFNIPFIIFLLQMPDYLPCFDRLPHPRTNRLPTDLEVKNIIVYLYSVAFIIIYYFLILINYFYYSFLFSFDYGFSSKDLPWLRVLRR